MAETAIANAFGSAKPISSLANITSLRAINLGSSPDSAIRAK